MWVATAVKRVLFDVSVLESSELARGILENVSWNKTSVNEHTVCPPEEIKTTNQRPEEL
jgi:hypothetical protein